MFFSSLIEFSLTIVLKVLLVFFVFGFNGYRRIEKFEALFFYVLEMIGGNGVTNPINQTFSGFFGFLQNAIPI